MSRYPENLFADALCRLVFARSHEEINGALKEYAGGAWSPLSIVQVQLLHRVADELRKDYSSDQDHDEARRKNCDNCRRAKITICKHLDSDYYPAVCPHWMPDDGADGGVLHES